jgi:hypothetical protein
LGVNEKARMICWHQKRIHGVLYQKC